jgi:hypothetical protein
MAGSINWDELAARVTANFLATGQWFVDPEPPTSAPPPAAGPVDWNALAAEVQRNFALTG